MNFSPSSSKATVITDPAGPGSASPYRLMLGSFEFLKTDT
jgi:hypothetical protein